MLPGGVEVNFAIEKRDSVEITGLTTHYIFSFPLPAVIQLSPSIFRFRPLRFGYIVQRKFWEK